MKRGITSVKAARGSRSVDEGASGEGDLPMRYVRVSRDAAATGRKVVKGHGVKKEAGIRAGDVRVPKDAVATGRKVGKVPPVKNLSKLKAAATSFEAKKPGAASAAGGVTKMEKQAGDVTLAVAAEADTAGKEGGMRLSQEYIDFVMSWKPEVHEDPDELYARMMSNPAFTLDEVERTTKLQRELVEQSMECAASVESFHAWVCAEFKEKGYVEVDEDYIARGVELRKALEEDELYAVAFGPMDGVVAEGDEDDDDDFALAAGPTMDGVLSED